MMEPKAPIQFWNRSTERYETELVYGEGAVRFLYETRLGRWLAAKVFSRAWFSKLYGALQSAPWSRYKVPGFVQKFSIDMSQYEVQPWRSFNDFFIRRFTPEARSFARTPQELPAFCEGRYFGIERLARHQERPIKGVWLPVSALLEDEAWISVFAGGPCLIARLCPVDYHRFHFPDDGTVLAQYSLHGPLESVNPTALAVKPDILFTNERLVQIIETKNFGKLAYIPVGAACVGKIVISHKEAIFARGMENGYFLFGGSTVVVLGEPGRWTIASDILEQSERGFETFVPLGEVVGRANL